MTFIMMVVMAVLVSGTAHAHKVVTSVYADGDMIEGEVGFSNGEPAPAGTVVVVHDDAGTKLAEVVTDAKGIFRYKPMQKTALVFRADLGGGHVAEAVLSKDELPGSTGNSDTPSPQMDSQTAPPTQPISAAMPADLRALIADAVRDEVKPLRREIAAYKEKNDLQSILGGIGYIVGLFGVGYYLAARRIKGTARRGADV